LLSRKSISKATKFLAPPVKVAPRSNQSLKNRALSFGVTSLVPLKTVDSVML